MSQLLQIERIQDLMDGNDIQMGVCDGDVMSFYLDGYCINITVHREGYLEYLVEKND